MNGAKAALRRALRTTACEGNEQTLCRRIMEHPWFLSAQTVMGYWAVSPEPGLRPVLEACLCQGKALALPRCEADGTMTARRVLCFSQLKPGAFGIPEPPAELPVVAPEQLDLILTPGMAFSPKGARLGRGKGYYDRFLARVRGKTLGVCFEGRVLEEIPMESHDRFVDAVLTDQRAILCEMEGEVCSEKGETPGTKNLTI